MDSETLEDVLVRVNELLARFVDHGLGYAVSSHAGQVLVKEAQVVTDDWLVGRLHFLLEELVDVESLEEGMSEDLSEITLCAETLLLILLKEALNQIFGYWRHLKAKACLIGEGDWALLDQVLHAVIVAMEEGGDAYEQLKKEDSECPPIDCVIMATTYDHLWR